MREIKFRYWDTDIKRMLYLENRDVPVCFCKDNNFPLLQFTELKDKNGVEIYEGDIVQIQHPCWVENTKVIFIDGSFVCEQLEKHPKNSGKSCPSFRDIMRSNWKLEVIGNIYQDSDTENNTNKED